MICWSALRDECLDHLTALKRVAIYGGTFDPVHNGHLEVARGVLRLFELDELILVPAWVPPHKRNAKITSAFHRFAMLALATQADQRLLVSTIELDAPDRPYAVDTIERMRGRAERLFFVIGADSWAEITTWVQWARLLTLCDLVVVTRPGYDVVPSLWGASVVDLRGQSDEEARQIINKSASPKVFVSDVVNIDAAATSIRSLARSGSSELRQMVPLPVANYIEKYGLYKTE